MINLDDISFRDASTLVGRSLVNEFSELDSVDSFNGEDSLTVSFHLASLHTYSFYRDCFCLSNLVLANIIWKFKLKEKMKRMQ